MSFTTPCFIRKNTKSLREKLEELGYNLCVCTKKTGSNYWLLTYTNGEVHVIDPSDQHDFIVKVMDVCLTVIFGILFVFTIITLNM